MVNAKSTPALLITLSLAASTGLRGDEPKDGKRRDATPFPPAKAAEVGIDPGALEKLRKRAEQGDSDAVVVVKDGRMVADWDFGRERGPIETASVTKSIVSLGIGRLVDSGRLKSLDQPVSDFYPEWIQGRKRQITIRHLLNHTSGLQNVPSSVEINVSPNFVQFALAAELSDSPGSKFSYNNKAVNLLAGIVWRASGTRMDRLIAKQIFEPLEITDFGWSLDRSGNPMGMAGLQIRAIDLAKIGQLMLDEGSWNGKTILSRSWVRQSVEPSQTLAPNCGLLWWLLVGSERYTLDDQFIDHLKARGMTEKSVAKLIALKGKVFGMEAAWDAVRPIVQADDVLKRKLLELNRDLPRLTPVGDGPVRGYRAEGYLGQYLVVVPRHRLVGVRQRRNREGTNPDDPRTNFGDFPAYVEALVPEKPPKP